MSTILNNLKTQWKQPSLLRAPQDSEGWVHLVCADCCVVSVLAHQVGCRWKWRLSLGSLLFLFLQRFSVYQASWCPRAGHHPWPKTCLSVPGVPEALPPSPALTHIRTWLESCSLDAWLGGWAKSEPLGIAMDLGDRGLLKVTSPSKIIFLLKEISFLYRTARDKGTRGREGSSQNFRLRETRDMDLWGPWPVPSFAPREGICEASKSFGTPDSSSHCDSFSLPLSLWD